MSSRFAVLATVIAVVAAFTLSPTLTGTAHAAEGELIVNNDGGNGAVTGQIADSTAGGATLLVRNENAFWTTVSVQTLGVDLRPAPILLGGGYAAAGVIAPGETAAWTARYDPTRAAQISVKTTPYLLENDTGGLAAALTIVDIAIAMFPESAIVKSRVLPTAAALRDAANAVNTAFGNEASRLLTVEELSSGRTGERILAALQDPVKLRTIQEAAGVLGVTLSKPAAKRFDGWLDFFGLFRTTLDLALAIGFQSSSGGVLFAYDGRPAPVVTPVLPTGDMPQAFLGTWRGTVEQVQPPLAPTRIDVVISQGSRG